ncbi:hypothetical protein JTE90_003919 [Oedothorax gibbosus]|uniref:C2H2-type domain-containing protein n=1 Tax=Oedothorax gibbosus TaxID=931172 RepID=A0AAV6TN35_9ARAC|nr:hypothetical protein JTE90_003919 [Oedothorax gibbosus]
MTRASTAEKTLESLYYSHRTKLVKCSRCDMQVLLPLLDTHMKLRHRVNPRLRCIFCNGTFRGIPFQTHHRITCLLEFIKIKDKQIRDSISKLEGQLLPTRPEDTTLEQQLCSLDDFIHENDWLLDTEELNRWLQECENDEVLPQQEVMPQQEQASVDNVQSLFPMTFAAGPNELVFTIQPDGTMTIHVRASADST